MELLHVENLSAGYGKQRIVEDVSFSVREGEIAGIFGENGCGKTTLLKGISGLGTRLSGNIYVGGCDVTHMRPKMRAGYLAMLASGISVPEGLLAEEVLEMGWYSRLPFLGAANAKMRKEKEDLIREMELETLISCYFDRLSQGQKQRVLLGRMLLQNTPVFLMDEPDNGLDFKHKHSFLRKMKTMAGEKKKAGVIILHDPSLALTYCDKIYVMKRGRFSETICPKEENADRIAEKLKEITGIVRVTKQKTSVIISPEYGQK